MSLKQYNPHLQLTFHKSKIVPLCAVALSVFILLVLWFTSLSWWGLCIGVLVACILVVMGFHPIAYHGELILSGNTLVLQGRDFPIKQVSMLLGACVLVSTEKQRYILLKGSLNEDDWHRLVRFTRLFKQGNL